MHAQIMHFPEGWEAANLPGLTRLKATGVTFNKAYTNSAMCSPARATLFSGFMPAQHGVRYVLNGGAHVDFVPNVS
jgi:choline-sulfatase